MSKSAERNRRIKIATGEKPQTKEKFLQTAQQELDYTLKRALPKLEAKTQNQKIALSMFRENRSVVFLRGSAGTGKSMLAAYRAACQLTQKNIDKVFLIRPAVAVGKSVGLLPGDLDEKLLPYFAQTLSHLEKFMGHGYLNYCLEKKVIEMQPVEYLRGRSFENCIVICEESQNLTKQEFEMVLTRLGDNCYIIFTGDEKQHDLKDNSGMNSTISLIERMQNSIFNREYLSETDRNELASNVGIVNFTTEDVLRSGLTKAFVKMYYNNDLY